MLYVMGGNITVRERSRSFAASDPVPPAHFTAESRVVDRYFRRNVKSVS